MGEARFDRRGGGRSVGRMTRGGRSRDDAQSAPDRLLLLTPFAVYWQTVFHEYGFRDDYSILREAHEEPGKLLELTISNGRPVYGMALDASLRPIRDVPDLPWLRLAAARCSPASRSFFGASCARRAGPAPSRRPSRSGSRCCPARRSPSVGYRVAIALALLFAVLGFARRRAASPSGGASASRRSRPAGFSISSRRDVSIERAVRDRAARGAAARARRHERPSHGRWVAAHLATLFASLVAAFFVMQLFFTEGVAAEATRMELQLNPLMKLWWFVRQPLANSLALFELRDRFDTSPWFWVVAASFAHALGPRFSVRRARRVAQGALAVLSAVPAVRRARGEPRGELAGHRLSNRVRAPPGSCSCSSGSRRPASSRRACIRPRLQQAVFGALLGVVAPVSAQRNAAPHRRYRRTASGS